MENKEVDEEITSSSSSSKSKTATIDRTMVRPTLTYKDKKRITKKIRNVKLEDAPRIETDYRDGLCSELVQRRMEDGYINMLTKTNSKSYKSIFFSNIFTFFNLITFIVAGALIAVGAAITQLFFLGIVIINIIIGIYQEIRAKIAVGKLSLITAPTAKVVRDSTLSAVPIGEVVLDDILYLETGKQICADAIVANGDIEVNESMLTGESVPVQKHVGDELFSGSFVTSGTCYARVEKVGKANYIEQLSMQAKKYRKPHSEMQQSIRYIMRVVGIFIIPITVLMILRNYTATNGDWFSIISRTSGSVIGMIPAGMFLLTTVALAVSVIKLAKKKTLVQDLYCIEMLARVNVLCLDKTGTITDGSMNVNQVIELKSGEGEHKIEDIIGSMLTATEDNNQTALALATKFGYSMELKPLITLPFSSSRKFSAVTFENAGTYILGAPELILKDMGVRIEKIVKENASNGFRVMVLAHSTSEIKGDKIPTVRRPVALIIIEDHIREDAVQTIAWFRDNDVAVKVISGDNPITVSEVARRVGVPEAEKYISLDGLSHQEVVEAANKYTVFGRVTPEQKCLLIKSIKAKGNTVAMTGDGVNDILAMRESDCSIAIASGSEAARNVAHLVLLDSNFTAMPDVVKEGRQVVNNIQKSSSLFLMKTFMSIVISIVTLIIVDMPYPFDTSNLLVLEMFVIGIPSFMLALQKNNDRITGSFLNNVLSRCLPGGIALVINIMIIYFCRGVLGISVDSPVYSCMQVVTLSYTGMIVLLRISQPLNGYRVAMLTTVFALSIGAMFLMKESIGIVPLSLNLISFAVNLILLSYAIVSIMISIFRKCKLYN